MVFVGGDDLMVNAINPSAGGAAPTLKWSYHTGSEGHAAPAIGPDGTVYVACLGWDLFAFNPNAAGPDGELKWRWRHLDERGLSSSPSVGADGTVYVGGNGNLHAISPPTGVGDGILKWLFHTEGTQVSAPAIGADGTVYMSSNDGNLYAIE